MAVYNLRPQKSDTGTEAKNTMAGVQCSDSYLYIPEQSHFLFSYSMDYLQRLTACWVMVPF